MSTELLQVIAPDGMDSGAVDVDLRDEDLLRLYRVMCTTRALDERALKLQRQGRIGFYVPSLGQEASHIGAGFALKPQDWVFPSYRDPGIALLRGATVLELLHQCYGNAADNSKGRQMPVHYSFRKINFVSISSPIGTQIVHAAGAAIAAKIRKDPVVTMTLFGDGSTSSNDFHAGMNFAGVFSAPCVFVCENNGWAISVPVDGQTASGSMADKAFAYGMPGIRVDGNDVLAVYSAATEAVERARRGGGPTLIEAVTFRLGPHSSSDDPTRYRSAALVEEWRKKDPITRLSEYLQRRKLWDAESEKRMQAEIQDELQSSIDAAEKVGPPPLSSLFDDVYAQWTPQLTEQHEGLRQAWQKGVVSKGHLGEFPL